jgi:hypothetical protein
MLSNRQTPSRASRRLEALPETPHEGKHKRGLPPCAFADVVSCGARSIPTPRPSPQRILRASKTLTLQKRALHFPRRTHQILCPCLSRLARGGHHDASVGRGSDQHRLAREDGTRSHHDVLFRFLAFIWRYGNVLLFAMAIVQKAKEHKWAEVARLLAEDPGLVRAVDADDWTVLHRACAAGALDTVKLCLKAGSEVEFKGRTWERTALHYAAEAGHDAVVEQLLSAKANVNSRDQYQQCPLHMAATKNRATVLELLLKRGAEVNAVDKRGY